MLEFEECKISGQLKADGIKGQYWIEEGPWAHMVIVKVTHAGPEIEKIGAYLDIAMAIKDANEMDGEEPPELIEGTKDALDNLSILK